MDRHAISMAGEYTGSHNSGFFHIKDVDEASHEQDYSHKSTLINSIDKIIGNMIDKVENSDDCSVLLT